MAFDISISMDPVSWAIEIFLIIYLARWFRFEKKEAKKNARRTRKKQQEVTVKVETPVHVGEETATE